MKIHTKFMFLVIGLAVIVGSCKHERQEESYIKKVELTEETIAVGIYKATGVKLENLKYISEAINIDGGIVYVTLTDADILKTKLDNIDVVLFPAMQEEEEIIALEDELVEIFKDFIVKKGKGVVGICNGSMILTSTPDKQTLDLVNVKLNTEDKNEFNEGIIEFKLTEEGEKIFPELTNSDKVFVNYQKGPTLEIIDDSEEDCKIIGGKLSQDINIPLFIADKTGLGKIFIINAHPEVTPGMRWMIPRIIRWVYGRESISYDSNVMRPGLFSNEIILNDELNQEIDILLKDLDNEDEDVQIEAMDKLQDLYPLAASEKVRSLLHEKNDDVKLRAAQFLVDIEFTAAIKDLEKAIKKERSRKVKQQLAAFEMQLEQMLEQN